MTAVGCLPQIQRAFDLSAFSDAKLAFDAGPGQKSTLPDSLVPVDGKSLKNLVIRGPSGNKLEEYYKWQFVYALINSGLYAKDHIGVEVRFPKGNKKSAPIKLDAAIFDDPEWVVHYNKYWKDYDLASLAWLGEHLVAVIEFKRGDKEIDKVFTGQIKPGMREKEPPNAYVLGMYYDEERLYLFHRREGLYLRYDEGKNLKGDQSKITDLSLHLPDPYFYIPSFSELLQRINKPTALDRSRRGIADLETITSIATVQLQDALSGLLRALDKAGLVNQRGYQILIEAFALKIFDEKRNDKTPTKFLKFYVLDSESAMMSLADPAIAPFLKRMKSLRTDASGQYHKILGATAIDWQNANHVRAVIAVAQAFQDFSFVRSSKSDLYQLVFYNFANAFKRDESAQFLTPLPVIEFMVHIVNPRNGERVMDPCCGIGDFLSLSFVQSLEKPSGWQLNDANIFGVDLDENMIMLATLNMLLNGDGEAKLFQRPDKGSISAKVAEGSPPTLVELIPGTHAAGNWDAWPDKTQLMQFDVVLTNPPFGDDRAFRPRNQSEKQIAELYETWKLSEGDALDLGVLFLENAYRILRENGRMGIVVSNSIASINRWQKVREWLLDRMRIVGLFDLPANVFAETGVNTSIIIAYKADPASLEKLNKDGYSIFVRDIQRVGYEKRTSKRNVFFNPIFRIDDTNFQVETDAEGRPVKDEEFSDTIAAFRIWALGQEKKLQELFLKES